MLQHTLGVNKYGEGPQYRNHYVASPGHHSFDACESLVAQGLMKRHEGSQISGNSPWFSVTRDGINAMHAESPKPPPPEKMSRSKARYRRFLKYGDMFDSFRDFLSWDSHKDHSWNIRSAA